MLKRATLVLLPGMDGTGKLFRGLLEAIPADWPRQILAYPGERVLEYGEMLKLVERELAGEGEIVLVAESYSGPIALRFAAAHPARVAAVVLCASFVCSPLPKWLGWAVGRWMFWIRPPKVALRGFMAGSSASDELVSELREAIGKVRPKVMARRVKDVFAVECADALRACRAPVIYLAGTRDALVGRASLEAITAIKPDVKICRVDGPHLLLQTEPVKAWREIEAFLIEIEMTSAGERQMRSDTPPP